MFQLPKSLYIHIMKPQKRRTHSHTLHTHSHTLYTHTRPCWGKEECPTAGPIITWSSDPYFGHSLRLFVCLSCPALCLSISFFQSLYLSFYLSIIWSVMYLLFVILSSFPYHRLCLPFLLVSPHFPQFLFPCYVFLSLSRYDSHSLFPSQSTAMFFILINCTLYVQYSVWD